MKLREELDFTNIVEKQRIRHEAKILTAVLEHLSITEFDGKYLSTDKERVKNYSVGIYTLRYKGTLIFRRFPMDISGLKFRYEAPIFNNVSEPKK